MANAMTVTVPAGWQVVVHFTNNGTLAHSLLVLPFTAAPPAVPAAIPVFPGAATRDVQTGLPVKATATVTFTAGKAGPTSSSAACPPCRPGHVGQAGRRHLGRGAERDPRRGRGRRVVQSSLGAVRGRGRDGLADQQPDADGREQQREQTDESAPADRPRQVRADLGRDDGPGRRRRDDRPEHGSLTRKLEHTGHRIDGE